MSSQSHETGVLDSRPGGGADPLVVGVDYGTLSGRAVVVRVSDGAELGSAVFPYPHAVMDRTLAATGDRLPPDWALQVPSDYVDVLRRAVPEALAAAGVRAGDVIGIGTDFTACTVLPGPRRRDAAVRAARVRRAPARVREAVEAPRGPAAGRPDHRARAGARRALAAPLRRAGSRRSGSSPRGSSCSRRTRRSTPGWTTGSRRRTGSCGSCAGTYVRDACTTGYKAIHQDGQYPSRDYLAALNPGFAGFAEEKVAHPIGALGALAGTLTAEAAAWTGLPEGIAVCVGNVDAHVTAPAAQAVEPGQMVAIMGTSTCHVMSSDRLGEVPGMCGVVDGGIVPGLWGYEAGQTGVGDIFGWFVDTCVPPGYVEEAARRGLGVHEYLTELAAAQPVGAHGLVALDWHNGNRSVLVDHELSGLVVGQTLATRPEDTYRALIEATAFGTRTIIEAFEKAGVPVTELVDRGRSDEERAAHADLRRRDRLPAERDRVGAGPGAGVGDPRGGRGGRLSRHPRGRRGHGQGAPGGLRPRRGAGGAPTTCCSTSTRRCTTTSGGGRRTTCMHRLRRIRTGGAAMTDVSARRSRRVRESVAGAARRAGPLRAGGVDGRERLRPRPGRRPDGHQAQRGVVRRADARRT